MNSRIHSAQRFCWYLLVALLPITSMPLIKKLLGSDAVASPAIIPLILLVFFWFLPGFRLDVYLPRTVLILGIFCCFTVIITFLSSFYPLPAYKGFGYLQPIFTALATLGIGFLFFIIASAFPRERRVKKCTLQIINWSGLVIILWSALQAIFWYATNHYPQWMFDLQGIFSSRVLYRQRVTGLALEPSWLAHQLNLLYLPFWLAASVFSFSCHRFRILSFSFENLLLFAGIITLGLTLSRVGFLAFFFMALLIIGMLHKRVVKRIQTRLSLKRKVNQHELSQVGRSLISLGLIIIYILILLVLVVLYSRFDPRMSALFHFSFFQENFLLRYFNELRFGDRVIYWLAGWNIFNQYPVLGVGLGNVGFLIPQNIEPYGWSLMEVRQLIHRESFLLNVKSLWFRLLAETGIIGFSLFIGWLISLLKGFINKLTKEDKMEKVLGLMGLLAWLALIIEGFSIDSFAMPYWWISLGLASSIVMVGSERMGVTGHPTFMGKTNG